MDSTSIFQEFDKLLVWYTSDATKIAHEMVHFLTKDCATASGTLYFIDAMDRFPIAEFQKALPPEGNSQFYDNVRIMTCLDMEELTALIAKVSQNTQRARVAHVRNTSTSQTDTLLILRGLDVIFRNTMLRDSPGAHRLLKDTMLRLRMMANTAQDFRTMALFPSDQRTENTSNSTANHTKKKPKLSASQGNSLSLYVSKFYADTVVQQI